MKMGENMSVKKTAGIIVTYNRKELLINSIIALLNQTVALDTIYIIDNCSTDGTLEYITKILSENTNIKYIRLSENLGGSGGFYEGIRRAYLDENDYIWGMDDDAIPLPTAHEELCKIRNEISDVRYCLWSNCNEDNEFISSYKKVDTWMFVGFYLLRNVIEAVGYPRRDFFIYHDDSEYAHRITKSGIPIFKVKGSVIDHTDGFSKLFYEKKIFGKLIQYPQLSNWRNYYFIRNFILKYSYKEIKKYYILFVLYPWFFLKILLLNPGQSRNFLKAYFHGVIGKGGIILKP
jgi:rhamnopyranosyl-N-acetylglucosaminyl-diphospho-decaprenol beta-1,3/1,4-galactofuranosyltransferase